MKLYGSMKGGEAPERNGLDRSQDFPVDPEIGREASSQREPQGHDGKTRGEEFEGDSYPNQRNSVNHERYRCDDEAEFRQGH